MVMNGWNYRSENGQIEITFLYKRKSLKTILLLRYVRFLHNAPVNYNSPIDLHKCTLGLEQGIRHQLTPFSQTPHSVHSPLEDHRAFGQQYKFGRRITFDWLNSLVNPI